MGLVDAQMALDEPTLSSQKHFKPVATAAETLHLSYALLAYVFSKHYILKPHSPTWAETSSHSQRPITSMCNTHAEVSLWGLQPVMQTLAAPTNRMPAKNTVEITLQLFQVAFNLLSLPDAYVKLEHNTFLMFYLKALFTQRQWAKYSLCSFIQGTMCLRASFSRDS